MTTQDVTMTSGPATHAVSDDTNVAATRPRQWWSRIALGAIVVTLVTLGTWASYHAEHRHDQYQLMLLGRCVHEGGRMYLDCWENKPPGLAWINALGWTLARGRPIGPWLLPPVLAAAALLIFARAAARTLSPASAALAAILGAAVVTLRLYDTPSINPDFYAAMFSLLGVSTWLLSLRAETKRHVMVLAVVAGLFFAAATLCKQISVTAPVAITGVALVLIVIRHQQQHRWFAATALSWVGFALTGAAAVAALHQRETLGPAWEAIYTFNRSLISASALCNAFLSWGRVWVDLKPVQLLLWLSVVGLLVTLRTRRAGSVSCAFICAMLLWWAAEAVLAQLGSSRSLRYWQAAFPPMLWLAAAGLFHLEDTYRRLTTGFRSAYVILLVTALALLGRPLADQYGYGLAQSYLSFSEGGIERERLMDISETLAALVPQDQAVYVWSYDPGIYVHSARRPASRFTYPRSVEQVNEILAGISAGKAFAILVPEHPAPVFDRYCDPDCRSRLSQILDRYTRVQTPWEYHMYIRQ